MHAVQADVAQTLAYYLPHFMAQIAIMGWMAQGRVMPVMSDVTQLLAASQIVKAVAHGLIRPKGHKFRVTAKGGDRSQRMVQWPLLRVFLVYLALTVAGVVWAFVFEDGNKLRDSSALCLFWSWYNILVLTIACVVCVEQPRLRASERLPDGRGRHRARWQGRASPAASSTSRLAARASPARRRAKPGTIVTVALGSLRVPGRIVRCAENEFAIHFDEDGSGRADLIRLIYSGRYSATVPRIEPARVAAAVLGRVMR